MSIQWKVKCNCNIRKYNALSIIHSRGGNVMYQKQYLRLLYSGLTTQQIYKLINQFPNFFTINNSKQTSALRGFLTTTKINNYHKPLQKFISLDDSDIAQHLYQSQVSTISIDHTAYPQILKEITDPPFILFYRGQRDLLHNIQTIAIVGSRKASAYTTKVLQNLYPAFKNHGLTVVSGLAKGADHIAHQLALDYRIPTIAVLAFGHLVHYPKETLCTRKTMEQIGVVISEYQPFQPVRKYHFAQRNRLISGLAKGLFITESTIKSGTQITVDCALDQNRDVYVAPGDMFNVLTQGNMYMAQQGAKVVLSAKDILIDYMEN